MPSLLRTRPLGWLLAAVVSTGGVVHAAEPTPVPDPASVPSPSPTIVDARGSRDVQGPFNVRRFALRDLSVDELSWTGEPPPPLPPDRTTDPTGVPVFRIGGNDHYRPGALAINGLKRIDAYRETGDRRHLVQALLQAAKLRELSIIDRGAVWLPFWFDYRPARLEAPWFNAMSQGLALSFFVRLHAVTRDPADRGTADRLFRSFLLLGPGRRPWIASRDRAGYLWLEHYPNGRHDHHLNAHLHAVLGLYEYWQATRTPIARMLLEGAITTTRDLASRFRRPGRPSFYSFRSRSVIVGYHDIHVWQLRLLGEMTGDRFFTRLGDDLAVDHPPKGYVPGRPAVDDLRVGEPRPPIALRVGAFPPSGAWSDAHA